VQPISAGIFGVPAGFAAIALVSLLGRWWPTPSRAAEHGAGRWDGPGL